MTIEPLTQDACAFYDDIGVIDSYSGIVLGSEEGRRVADALGMHKAVILRNHGMLTVGTTVESAAWWFLTLERSAGCQLDAYAAAAGLGTAPRQIDPDIAKMTRDQIGYEYAGWFQFQPIWQRISRDQPDIFE
jgi:ribulose-5-phosphate 4-epimerase/fuculose-1-phosphate aldolase